MSSRYCNSKVYVVNCCKYRAKPSLQVVKYQSADNQNIADISYQYAIYEIISCDTRSRLQQQTKIKTEKPSAPKTCICNHTVIYNYKILQ